VRAGSQVHVEARGDWSTVSAAATRSGGGSHGVALTHLLPDVGRFVHSGPLISIGIEAYGIHRRASMCRIETVETPSCCTPITDQALSPPEAEELAGDFKVLADPIRLRLLSIIASVP